MERQVKLYYRFYVPGNNHSNKWSVGLLKRIIIKIRKKYPKIKITIQTDSGFSDAPFYELVDEFNLFFATGIASNNVLKQEVAELAKEIKDIYLSKKEKHQEFISNSESSIQDSNHSILELLF